MMQPTFVFLVLSPFFCVVLRAFRRARGRCDNHNSHHFASDQSTTTLAGRERREETATAATAASVKQDAATLLPLQMLRLDLFINASLRLITPPPVPIRTTKIGIEQDKRVYATAHLQHD